MGRAKRAARPTRGVSRTAIVLAAMGLTLLAAGCGSGSGTSTPNQPADFFGVVPAVVPDSRDFTEMSKAGVETVRLGFGWASVEPHPGAYAWASTDARVGGLAAEGIESLPVLTATPAWVAQEPTTPPLGSARAKQAWTGFVKAAVDRYGPDGSFWRPAPNGGDSPFHALCHCDADPMPITSWQVWNEPSLSHYFTPEPSVAKYAELLRITHDAIKGADPQAQIVLAGLPGYAKKAGGLDAWQYLSKLFRRPGADADFDVVALHPYSRNVHQLGVEVAKVRAVMRENGDSAMPLWITEMGWGSASPDRFGINKGLEGQKDLLTQAFRLVLRNHAQWHLDRVYWFVWRDPPPSTPLACSFCGSAGLLRNDRKPKPSYHAYTRFTRGRDG